MARLLLLNFAGQFTRHDEERQEEDEMKNLTQNTIKFLLAAALFAAIQSNALAKKPVKNSPPAEEPPVEEPATEEPTSSLTGKIRAEVAASGLYKVTAAQIAATLGGSESEAAAAIATRPTSLPASRPPSSSSQVRPPSTVR